MKRLDRFILKSFIGPFVAILIVVIFILMMQFLWLYIDELVGKGLGLGVILEFMMWGGCTVLPLAMPLSTLLASMMTLGQMGENSELIALKAAGISVQRIMAPIMVSCAFITVGAFFAVNNLVPYATNQIYTMRDDISRTNSEIKIPVGTFYDGIEGFVLRIGGRNEKTGMMYEVQLYDHSNNRGNTNVTIADSGMMKLSKAKDYLTIQLFNGTNYQENNSKKYKDTTLALQRFEFSKQETILKLENYAFQKSDSVRFSAQVRSMNLGRLYHTKDSLGTLAVEDHARHVEEFLTSSNMRFHDQLDSAWRAKPRTMFEPENYMGFKSDYEHYRAFENAASVARQMESTLRNYSIESYEQIFVLRRVNVEILGKYAKALACLILFFIGAPVGAIIRKGGLGTSAIVSVLFFLLYYVVDISGLKLAKDGAVSPFFGDFLAAFVLLAIGIFLTWKATHDSTLGNDSLKGWWRKIKSKIVSLFKKTRIVYMGTPEFSVAPLESLLKGKYKIVGVVTVPDKPSGRGLQVSESPVKRFAVASGLPVLQPVKLKDPAFLAELASLKADMFVVVGFRMLPEEVWRMPRLGTFNLHAALLPQYRGAAPINWAIINGESITGVTTFMIDKQIDTGGIILRQEVRIAPDENAGSLHDRLMITGADLVVQTVQGIIEGNVETRVQKSFIQGSEILKTAPKLTKELMHIDWNDTTAHIYNLVRGLSPYPAAFTFLTKEGAAPAQLKIFAAEKIESDQFQELLHRCGFTGDSVPAYGTIVSDGKLIFAVATADGALSLTDLQLAGKKRMSAKAFLAGFRDPSSYKADEGTSKDEIAKTRIYED